MSSNTSLASELSRSDQTTTPQNSDAHHSYNNTSSAVHLLNRATTHQLGHMVMQCNTWFNLNTNPSINNWVIIMRKPSTSIPTGDIIKYLPLNKCNCCSISYYVTNTHRSRKLSSETNFIEASDPSIVQALSHHVLCI